MATTSDQTKADAAKAALTTTLTGVDAAMQVGLTAAAKIHQARLSQQQRYAAAAETEFGAKDAGVLAAQAQVAATKMVLGQVSAAYQQGATPAPSVSAGQWALQGRVYDSAAQPLAALTVFLVNEDKAWLRDYGFSYTDDTGLFSLEGNMPEDDAGQMYVEIANSSGLPIYLASSGFAPVQGKAVYQKIMLRTQTPLGDPPQPIRATSMPSETAGTAGGTTTFTIAAAPKATSQKRMRTQRSKGE